jgi:hypothetical protein
MQTTRENSAADKRWKPVRVLPILLLLSSLGSQASERIEACVRYETRGGWSNAMQVRATATTGEELAQSTGNWTRFQPLSKYVVIFWEKGEASVINIGPWDVGSMPLRGADQAGRVWQVSIQDPCF